jgi:hypothetical protein
MIKSWKEGCGQTSKYRCYNTNYPPNNLFLQSRPISCIIKLMYLSTAQTLTEVQKIKHIFKRNSNKKTKVSG